MKKLDWKSIRELWEKNGCPSAYKLQSMLEKKGITIDGGNTRKAIRKWRKEIYFIEKANLEDTADMLWDRIKEDSKRFIKHHRHKDEKLFYLENESKPIGISFISDQHFGNVGVEGNSQASGKYELCSGSKELRQSKSW